MKRDSRLSGVLHVLLHMAQKEGPQTSEVLAKAMDTNPVVLRRVMAGLRDQGYVQSEKGHGGGWTLACDLNKVTLLDVYHALGSPSLFAMGNRTESPGCVVEEAVNAALSKSFDDAESLLLSRLGEVTLAALSEDVRTRLAARNLPCAADASAASHALYDVIIVGGGPGGLAAALTLGRARKRVLLCDSGPRRNAAARHIHNFITRDGTPPEEFRRIGRAELAAYPNVRVEDVRVESISGARGAFHVHLSSGVVEARRVLLCTGMIDEPLPLEGFKELWGQSIFQCPYCHGWEVQDRAWGYLVGPNDAQKFLPFALMLRGWTSDLVVFTDGAIELPAETEAQLQSAGIRLETAAVQRLVAEEGQLKSVELSTGAVVTRDVLFTHPPQHQVDLVKQLGIALDGQGYVGVDAMKGETSILGIYAAGDLTTQGQGAIWAAAASARAAAMINFELTVELAPSGGL